MSNAIMMFIILCPVWWALASFGIGEPPPLIKKIRHLIYSVAIAIIIYKLFFKP